MEPERNATAAHVTFFTLALALAAGGAWWWISHTSEPDDPVAVSVSHSSNSGRPQDNGSPDASSIPFFQMLAGELPKLTDRQVRAFVEDSQRSPESLIAAWDLTGDKSWLKAAATEHPNSPNVAMAMLMHLGTTSKVANTWIRSLRENDPENAAGHLFAARAAFAAGDASTALVELEAMAAAGRTDFYITPSRETLTAAYQYADTDTLVAGFAGMFGVRFVPAEITGLNRDIAAAMEDAHLAGEDKFVRSLGEAGMTAAARTVEGDAGRYFIGRLIGTAMQRQVLDRLDTFQLVPGDRELVIERIEELDREIATIRELIGDSEDLLSQLTEKDAAHYLELLRTEGEMEAMVWLRETLGGP